MKKHLLLLCLALISLCSYAQTSTGLVKDKTGEPMIGVNVLVKGTSNGTITDIDGKFTIHNVPNDATLIVSYLGYLSQKVKAGKNLMILLEEDTKTLDEVVVIGYGLVKKSDLTSSISSVKGKSVTEVTTGNAMDALQGKVNGVQVMSGGEPGATPKVLIRGVTTVNGSRPLYVVDGMPVGDNINFLNSNDIESMEVLKDASASAIYGTRGSNGVILITTKKGTEGKPRFNFVASVGFQTIVDPNIAAASEYEKVFKARYINENRTPIWNSKDNITDSEGTDWWNEVINKTALVQNYAFSVSGGSDKFTYNLSVGYFRNKSQYDVGYWDKLNARLNTEYTFNKYVKVGFDIAPRMESWENTPNQFRQVMSMDPTTPVMRPEEEWDDNMYNNFARSKNNEEWNPVAAVARSITSNTDYGAILNPYLQLSLLDGLTLRSQFGTNIHFRRSDSFTPKFKIDQQEKSVENVAFRKMESWHDWNWTNTINYTKSFAQKHNINLLAGFTAERFAYYYVSGSRDAIPNNSEVLQEVSAGTLNQLSNGNTSYNSLLSYIGRIMYNYDNRYYLTASLRADGSSKFPKENRYAFFPSVSAAWRVTSEKFMENQHVFDNLKVRTGWGRVGNQSISNSAYLTLIGNSDAVFGPNQDRVVGTTISSVGNKELKWEIVEDYNFGLDMSFLDSRLDVTFDIYKKKSSDMLYSKQNIFAVGYPNWNSTITTNIGSMQATGWELSFNWNDTFAKEATYSVGLNLSSTKNKAIKLSGDGPIYTGKFNSDQIIRNEDGSEIGRFYGFVSDGLFQNMKEIYSHTDEHGNIIQPNAKPGDIRFKDLNHDGVLDENDKTYIGNAYPDLILGLNLGLNYKNLDITANFYGTFGNDVFNTTKKIYAGANGYNVFAGTLDKAWHGEGTSFDIPRLTVNDNNQNYNRISSFYVEDGSYFRCKLLQMGYTLPKALVRDTEIRFSLSVQNPFTITGYSGMDPERPQQGGSVIETGIDWIAYPNPRTFLFGVDVKF